MSLARALPSCLVLLALAACEEPLVSWSDPTTVPVAAVTAEGRLTVDGPGLWRIVADAPLASLPADPRACPGSLRAARRDDGGVVVTWWSVRSDSSAALVAAVSADGARTWGATIPVDTMDASVVGCARPAPAIAARGDFVHVAYSMRAREGSGIFYAHSMSRGATWEPPRAIVYGERMAGADVAADGDRVIVAYADPSAASPQIGLALSRTMGHIFEDRTVASTGVGAASSPRVALAGHDLAVTWLLRADADVAGTANGAAAAGAVRLGTIR